MLLTLHAMTDARHLLEALADDYLRLNHPHTWVLKITPKCLSNPQLTKLVIRRWIKLSGTTGIPAYTLDTLCEQLQVTGSDHKVAVRWGNWSLHWYRSHLWLQEAQAVPPCPTAKWAKGTTDIDLGQGIGRLELEKSGRSIDRPRSPVDGLPGSGLTVGARSNTQESVIRLGGHHKSLKNLFQSADIPPWLRDSIPLCMLNGEIVSIGDWCLNEDFARWLTENDMSLSWRPEHPLLNFIRQQQHQVKG